ncbi:MAG TPA: prolyl oligopeptidase family serine peptidase [Chloroflexota bacterium]|nr:prolyl oligopeptidase family serine peptidase [Chloroflexota bacterium]
MDSRPSAPASNTPATRRDDVVDVLHGRKVADPYRWLEDGDAPETRSWVAAQNAFTRATLDGLPDRPAIHARLDGLLTTGAVSTPALRGERAFYQRRGGRADQPVLLVRDGTDGAERAIVDPNAWSQSGVVALDWWFPSADGRLLAYGLSQGGDELSVLRVLEVETGQSLPDEEIPHTRAASVAWLPDSSGFYYTRYPTPGTVAEGEEMYNRHVFFHRLGQAGQDDEEIFGAGRAREDWPYVDLSHDGRWLVVEVSQGWARSEIHLLDRQHADRGFVAVHTGVEALASTLFAGQRVFVLTNQNAPNYALFEIDPEHPAKEHWRLVLPERADYVLQRVDAVAGVLVAHEMHNASSQLRLYQLDGALVTSVALPSIGTVTGIGGEFEGSRLVVGFTSFAQPPTAYVVDLANGGLSVFAQGELPPGFDASQYEVRQQWYTSRDGTPVSMFVIHRRGGVPSGAPTLLTGYGGFNVSRTPMFVAALPLWLDAGGVYALANLRGGGEYGEAWHQAGMLGNKQNVFDDFLSAAEFLSATGLADRGRVAISGGSNGGLLVGAALTQRPELFRAVVCQVPLLDMLRYQHLRIARLWVAEYGSAEDAAQFEWLYAYSPYHRVRSGERYPSTFLLTAEGDSRVDPMHARKMAARLQAATASEAPVLLRVETAAGHGQGKPRSKQLEEATDVWSFLMWQLDVRLAVN